MLMDLSIQIGSLLGVSIPPLARHARCCRPLGRRRRRPSRRGGAAAAARPRRRRGLPVHPHG